MGWSEPCPDRKRYYRHLSRDRREATREMAARILDVMESRNRDSMPVSELKRILHAHRYARIWDEGVAVLVGHRLATRVDGKLIRLNNHRDVLPSAYRKPKPKRRRSRGQSEWFQGNRNKIDAGQHSDFHEDLTEGEAGQYNEDEEAAAAAWWAQPKDLGLP